MFERDPCPIDKVSVDGIIRSGDSEYALIYWLAR